MNQAQYQLTPQQKSKIIKVLASNNNVVDTGFTRVIVLRDSVFLASSDTVHYTFHEYPLRKLILNCL